MAKIPYQVVVCIYAVAMVILSVIKSVDQHTGKGRACGFHAALTFLYAVYLPTTNLVGTDIRTLELVCFQLITAVFLAFDDPRSWHYVYFPGIGFLYALSLTYRIEQTLLYPKQHLISASALMRIM